ncbi:MAG: DUF58 domain-containing protein, partial [Verrucomicrobiota bacterium]
EGTHLPPWIILGLPFPRPLTSENEEQRFLLKAGTHRYRTRWDFLSPERGLFHIGSIYWLVPSRFGLWHQRGTSAVDLPIRIYPDLRRDKKTLANLFMNRGLSGMKLQRLTGQGRDYDQVREYEQGDSLMDMHWKATAKRNNLMARTYQIERTQEIYVVIDHSRLSARRIQTQADEHSEQVLERFVAATNVLGLAALREGDLFGLVTFSRNVTGFVRAGAGPGHLKSIQNSIFDLKPEKAFPDYDELCRFVRLQLRRRSLIILLTDLSDPAVYESFASRVQLLSRRHILLVNMVAMAGVNPVFDRADGAPQDIYRELAGHLIWKDLNDYKTLLMRKRVSLQLLQSENLALDIVNQYLTVKKRQLL